MVVSDIVVRRLDTAFVNLGTLPLILQYKEMQTLRGEGITVTSHAHKVITRKDVFVRFNTKLIVEFCRYQNC